MEILSLLLISGGTLVLGALVAPNLFANLSRQEAGATMMEIFVRFEQWLKIAAGLVLVAEIFEAVIFGFSSLAFVLGLAIAANSFYIIQKLSPHLEQAYNEHSAEFEALHKQSELHHKANFILSALLLLLLAA